MCCLLFYFIFCSSFLCEYVMENMRIETHEFNHFLVMFNLNFSENFKEGLLKME